MNLKGKKYLVTGASSGIGLALVKKLLAAEAEVGIVCRDQDKIDQVLASPVNNLEHIYPFTADLSVQSDITHLAAKVLNKFDKLDGLINNAGVFTKKQTITEDGFELQFAVNYLAQVHLNVLLLPIIKESNGRIVNVASMEHMIGKLYPQDMQLTNKYLGTRAYRQSKLAVVMATASLASRVSGVTVNAVHPGVVYTKLVHTISPLAVIVKKILKSPDQGAEAPFYVATDKSLNEVTGKYFHEKKISKPAKEARDQKKNDWLLDHTLEMLKLNPKLA